MNYRRSYDILNYKVKILDIEPFILDLLVTETVKVKIIFRALKDYKDIDHISIGHVFREIEF